MTKRVQIIGHNAEDSNEFIGVERELTADTDNWCLQLHDGATPGGHTIYNRDMNDIRYQARSPELDGLLGWEPNERGILARQGPANYHLVEILGHEDNIGINFGSGYTDNPQVYLLDTITSNHTWLGQHIFDQVVTSNGGFEGDLVGNTTGTHVGPVIGDVEGDANGNHTGTFTGDVNVQGSTLLLDDDQIEIPKINGLSEALAGLALPAGIILMWSGDESDIPDGWTLCDGTGGAPDLRARFIVGAPGTYPAHTSGGAANHTHSLSIDASGAHTHTITVSGHAITTAEMPAHTHNNGVVDNSTILFNHGNVAASPTTSDSIESNSSDGTTEGVTSSTGSGDAHSHAASSDSQGSHTHTNTLGSTSHLPPYYALCYIMRTV